MYQDGANETSDDGKVRRDVIYVRDMQKSTAIKMFCWMRMMMIIILFLIISFIFTMIMMIMGEWCFSTRQDTNI